MKFPSFKKTTDTKVLEANPPVATSIAPKFSPVSAYAPAKQPKIAVAVLVENAGWGGSVAAPIARKVFDAWLLRDQKAAPAALSSAPVQRGAQ